MAVSSTINLVPVEAPDAQTNFDEIKLRWSSIPGVVIYDTGWFAEEATTNHATTLTHSLALDLRTPPADIECWFSPTDPTGASSPATIYKKPLRGMQVDDALAAGQGYDNPASIQLTVNTIALGFYSPHPLHAFFNVTTATWTLWQTGWLRLRLRAT